MMAYYQGWVGCMEEGPNTTDKIKVCPGRSSKGGAGGGALVSVLGSETIAIAPLEYPHCEKEKHE